MCTRNGCLGFVVVEEEGGGEAQWSVRVWVNGKELEVDDEEEEESVGNDCSGFAFMTGPFGRNGSLEWEKVGAWFEFFWEEEDNAWERVSGYIEWKWKLLRRVYPVLSFVSQPYGY